MKIYLVGGAVRDGLLGLDFHERDWVVVGADEQQMLDLGYRRADADFPVFLHPQTGEEYALARRETKTGAGYKGFSVETGPDVTLEQDLARRDLTINAMAQTEAGEIIDPYNGRQDLDAGFLRHVTPAFVEDPVRLLRVARFAAKLGAHGFRLAHPTFALMKQMAASDDLASLKMERLWREMRKALAEPQPWRFFETLQRCGALAQLIPELSAQMAPGAAHGDSEGSDVMAPLKRAVAAGASADVCFAVALAGVEADVAALCHRLRAEKPFAELLADVGTAQPVFARLEQLDAAGLLSFLQHSKAQQRPDYFARLLVACGVLSPEGAESRLALLHTALLALAEVSPEPLLAEGLSGAELGAALQQAREAALVALLHRPAGGC